MDGLISGSLLYVVYMVFFNYSFPKSNDELIENGDKNPHTNVLQTF